MAEQVKKTPCSIGLLAHVCANGCTLETPVQTENPRPKA